MAKKMSKPTAIIISVILALGFITLSLFTFGQFKYSKTKTYMGIFSLVEVSSDINDSVVAQFTLKEEEGEVSREDLLKSVEIIRNRLNIGAFSTSVVNVTNDGFIVELPNKSTTSEALNYFCAQGKITVATSTKTYLTHEDIKSASVQKAYTQDGINVSQSGYTITLNFTSDGQAKFHEATKEVAANSSGGTITIMMDDTITLFSANVTEEIDSSSVQIGGEGNSYTKEQAEIIASAINGGVLENAFEMDGNAKIYSSVLGEKAGLKIILGLVAIMLVAMVLFVVFYKGLGVVADLTILFSVEAFGLIYSLIPGSTITLPALCGIILAFVGLCAITITIFEKIKSERANGKTTNSSINNGFNSSYMIAIDIAVLALLVFLCGYFVVGAYVKTLIVALAVALGVVAFSGWVINRGIVALFKGFVNQDSFYNLEKEEEEN